MKHTFGAWNSTIIFGLAVGLGFGLVAEAKSLPEQLEARHRDIYSYILLKQSGAKIPVAKPNSVNSVEWLNAMELAQDESHLQLSLTSFVDPVEVNGWPLASRLRAVRLNLLSAAPLMEELRSAISQHQLDAASIDEVLNLQSSETKDHLPGWDILFAELRAQYPKETLLFDRLTAQKPALTTQEVSDLYSLKPQLNLFNNGSYDHKPRLFIFCRQDRSYPCLRVMKDLNDQPVRNADGTLWSLPALGLSKYGKPFNVADGNTPEGVHLIDGVIQTGSDPIGFGKFSRVVLNFVPKSADEADIKLLLPASSQGLDWWNEAVIARDIGRANLRLHGTGVINNDPNAPYFPLVPTSGCVASRENTYDGVSYTDQKELLETFQKSMGLTPSPDNEAKIGGLLYVIELDNLSAAVTLTDLASYGIK